jgi:hypothetical protein
MIESNSTPKVPPALDVFVSELLQTTGSLMLIVDHMTRFGLSGRSAPDSEPVPEVLTKLLASVLGPLLDDYGADALMDAARIVGDTGDIACDEIFQLSTPEFDRISGRHGRPRRRRPS